MDISNITKYFKNVKKCGIGWTALCPAHDDRKNSLSIGLGENGKILLHCHAGCSTESILRAAGLKTSDLFPNKAKPEKLIEAVYPYKDEKGNLLYEVIRYYPKDFRQRRPDGKGGYIYNLQGVTPVLYRLPEVLEAVRSNKPVLIVEGEKDVDNLFKLGFTATTNSGGAGKWRDSFSDALKEAHVVIIPDADEPGRKHAEQVAESLKTRAKSIKILHLPDLQEKQDVTDFLRKHGKEKGKELLTKLIAETPEWWIKEEKPLFICMGSIEVQEVKFLWKPYIPLGKITLLQGDPGSGKTFIAANIAAAVSTGKPLPYGDIENPVQGNVIYQTAEDGIADTLKPRLIQAGADCSKIFTITEETTNLTLTDERLEEAIKQLKPRLLIIDPLQAYIGAETDLHRANEVRPKLAHIARLAETYEMAVILVMHLNKNGSTKGIYRGLGSIDIPAASRSVLIAGCDSKNPNERAIVHIKSSLAPKGESISYILNENGFSWGGLSTLTADDILNYRTPDNDDTALDEAKEFLNDVLQDGPVSANDIYKMAKNAGHSKRTIERAKKELNVTVKKIGFGKESQWIWELPNNKNSLAAFDANTEKSGIPQRPPMATYVATFEEETLQRPPKRPPMAFFDESIDNTTFQSKTAKEKHCSEMINELFKQAGL